MNDPIAFKTEHPLGMNYYLVPFQGRYLSVIADSKQGWDHVSISLTNRNPNWDEMCFVKNLFWNKDEMAIQFHPVEKDYVNLHNHCLHIWKPPEPLYTMLLNSNLIQLI